MSSPQTADNETGKCVTRGVGPSVESVERIQKSVIPRTAGSAVRGSSHVSRFQSRCIFEIWGLR
jgi:hypothetical protein